MTPRTVAALFAGAGAGLAACDLLHVRGGVLRHRAGGPFGQAWWVAPMFGTAGVAIVTAARPFARATPVPSAGRIARLAAPFAIAYAATALLANDHPRPLAAALWSTGVARTPRRDLAFTLLLAAAGPAVEYAIASRGHFAYARPAHQVVPWLSGLYVHGAPMALAVSSRTSDSGAARR